MTDDNIAWPDLTKSWNSIQFGCVMQLLSHTFELSSDMMRCYALDQFGELFSVLASIRFVGLACPPMTIE